MSSHISPWLWHERQDEERSAVTNRLLAMDFHINKWMKDTQQYVFLGWRDHVREQQQRRLLVLRRMVHRPSARAFGSLKHNQTLRHEQLNAAMALRAQHMAVVQAQPRSVKKRRTATHLGGRPPRAASGGPG